MTDSALVEQLFDDLLSKVDGLFSKEEIAEVQHFVDVGEYGVAIEAAISIITENNKSVTSMITNNIRHIVDSMEMNTRITQKMFK